MAQLSPRMKKIKPNIARVSLRYHLIGYSTSTAQVRQTPPSLLIMAQPRLRKKKKPNIARVTFDIIRLDMIPYGLRPSSANLGTQQVWDQGSVEPHLTASFPQTRNQRIGEHFEIIYYWSEFGHLL
jgi:hypothetical protein